MTQRAVLRYGSNCTVCRRIAMALRFFQKVQVRPGRMSHHPCECQCFPDHVALRPVFDGADSECGLSVLLRKIAVTTTPEPLQVSSSSSCPTLPSLSERGLRLGHAELKRHGATLEKTFVSKQASNARQGQLKQPAAAPISENKGPPSESPNQHPDAEDATRPRDLTAHRPADPPP
eukprot:1533945-Rhodomonas_salina.3